MTPNTFINIRLQGISLLVFIFFFLHPLFSQQSYIPIKNYVQANLTVLDSDGIVTEPLKQLENIGNAIGSARIVMLGEQDHGDAATFLMKSEIVKYLHEVKGFNVLAFEADFFSVNMEYPNTKGETLSWNSFVKENISRFWADCDKCSNLLYNYIPSTMKSSNPLTVTGFDTNLNSRKFIRGLDSLIRQLNLFISKERRYDSIVESITKWYENASNYEKNNLVDQYLHEIKAQLVSKLSSENFWVKSLDNFIQMNKLSLNANADYWDKMNQRDSLMSVNLRWLLNNKLAGEKVIIWAHSYHVSKYCGNYPDAFLNPAKTMGCFLAEDKSINSDDIYVLGFTSYQGKAGRIGEKAYSLPKLNKNSLENWIDKSIDFAFVNFKRFNMINPNNSVPFFMSGGTKGNRYHDSQSGVWNKIFDGVFFIRNMYNCN